MKVDKANRVSWEYKCCGDKTASNEDFSAIRASWANKG